MTSNLWDSEKVILNGEVLEVRNVDGRLYVARMPRFHNDWDPSIEPYDPYGPGEGVTRNDSDEATSMSGEGILSTENLPKVLERMGVTENDTLNVRREEGGKIRVTSNLWNFEKVILKDEVLEVRNVDGRLYVARMPRFHNDWDPPIEPYDPYGPGEGVTRNDSDEASDD